MRRPARPNARRSLTTAKLKLLLPSVAMTLLCAVFAVGLIILQAQSHIRLGGIVAVVACCIGIGRYGGRVLVILRAFRS